MLLPATRHTSLLSPTTPPGKLPSALPLRAVIVLDLRGNAISGPLRASLFTELPALQSLDLTSNALTGPVPSSFGAATSGLRMLALSENRLVGPVPESIGDCTALRHLALAGNALTGELPALGPRLTLLAKCYLNDNRFSGGLGGLGPLESLTELWASTNALQGPVPGGLFVGSPRLARLYLYANRLTGPMPVEAAAECPLEVLDVSGNAGLELDAADPESDDAALRVAPLDRLAALTKARCLG